MKIFWLTAVGMLLSGWALAQATITGTVLDENNEPLIGAVLQLDDSYLKTTTDLDGAFAFKVNNSGKYAVQARFIGYAEQTITVTVTGAEASAANFTLEPAPMLVKEFTVSATRADDKTPMANSNMDKEAIAEENLGQDMPYVLRMQPSVVVTSDAGAGVGYTGIRIRGSDASRVNVTVNGIPYNDAESQGVFWVDMPDIASSTESVQIQRGVGTSTNGAGAFGGTVNVSTTGLNAKPHAQTSHTYGSFNTRKHNLSFGTGLIDKHWTVDGRVARITSDGYVDRATADLNSYFLSGGYTAKKSSVRLNVFSGHEITYQAWNGIPKAALDTNRTYNSATYDNEVDNYTQTHYQLLISQQISPVLNFNAAGFYTRGLGFFENYEAGESLDDFGIGTQIIGGDTITNADLIQRRWLDNHFYGTTWSFNYNNHGRLKATLGGSATRYEGQHYGEVIWSEFAGDTEIRNRYYDNDATKNDLNIYGKASFQATNKLNLFGDVQYRMVEYTFLGFDADANNVNQTATLDFINPKAGLTYELNDNNTMYASVSVGNKEPNRNDYTESSPNSRPEHETLLDYELGYKRNMKSYGFGANVYYMDYTNQLVPTGQLNDVGATTRVNVDDSYRAGVELEFGWQVLNNLEWTANATFSQNTVVAFTEYQDSYDADFAWIGQEAVEHSNTDLAFSPGLIAASNISYTFWKKEAENEHPGHKAGISFITKYVGEQFIDNTSDENAKLDAYLVNDVRLRYRLTDWAVSGIDLNVTVRNIADELYSSNAWVYRYQFDGATSISDGYYPQAGRHFLVGLTISF